MFIPYFTFAAEDSKITVSVVVPPAEEIKEEGAPVTQPDVNSTADVVSASDNVTLDFKEADIQNVLKIISLKANVNIVSTPEVVGNVSMRLIDVPWETALDVILKTYGYSYQRQGNIILVTKIENIAKMQAEEPLQTEIFTLKYLDAQDAQKIIIPLLSPRGRISVLYARGQKGWQFGTFKIGKDSTGSSQLAKEKFELPRTETISIENTVGQPLSRKAEFEPSVKSKIVIVTDTASSLDRIRNVILPSIDKKPKQVLIETRIMEVKQDRLRDLGIDWGTGLTGATATTPGDVSAGRGNTVAGRNLGGGQTGGFTPYAFNPLEGATAFPGTYPYIAGAEFIYKKISGTDLEIILHALEEDGQTNTLSAPKILTLDNQEASILVGYHTPILLSTVAAGTTGGTGTTVTQTLDYYQEIGIRLNVVPQISEAGYINMIVHPSVTSSTSNVIATSLAGSGVDAVTTQTAYPIIDVREAQTQIMVKNKDTIVIGGLLKDVKTKENIGVPILSKIPLLGMLFTRQVWNTSKIDLLIFITARIVEEDELSKEDLKRFEKGADYVLPPKAKSSKK
jgi:type IV pilus secretin PilQ/predicted competence protein